MRECRIQVDATCGVSFRPSDFKTLSDIAECGGIPRGLCDRILTRIIPGIDDRTSRFEKLFESPRKSSLGTRRERDGAV
jgi:hypothetical protein